MSQIILQKFANREVRIGAQSIAIAPKKKGDRALDVSVHKFSQKILDYQVAQANLKEGWEIGQDRRGCAIAIPYGQEQFDRQVSRLDIISEFQDRSLKVKKRGGWGFAPRTTTFGKKGRHLLLEGGAVMDSLCGKNVAMVTCTIPGKTEESARTVADWSGWIMNRITQIMRDSGKDVAWFYVFELQKRGALHIHFAIGSSSLREALTLAQEIEFRWFELLLELKDKTGVDVFKKNKHWSWRHLPENWKSDVQVVGKSVAAYFSKYASKNSGKSTRWNRGFCPARWWGSSKSIKRGIEDARIKISIEVPVQNVEKATTFLRDVISSFNPIKSYRYDFDLGKSAMGTDLGGGWREISYLDDLEFGDISGILDSLAEYITQTWGVYADIPPLPTQTSKYKSIIGTEI